MFLKYRPTDPTGFRPGDDCPCNIRQRREGGRTDLGRCPQARPFERSTTPYRGRDYNSRSMRRLVDY